MTEVEDFIYQFEGNQREIMLYFHHLLSTELNLTDKIRFKLPFYYGRTWICYLVPARKCYKIRTISFGDIFIFLNSLMLSSIGSAQELRQAQHRNFDRLSTGASTGSVQGLR